MNRIRVGALTTLVLALLAPKAEAQVCAGYPTIDNQLSIGGSYDFPDEGELWGLEISYDIPGPLGVFGGLEVSSPEEDDEPDDTYFAGASYDLLSFDFTLPVSVSICPTAKVGYTDVEDGAILTAPLGLGFGTSLSATRSMSVMPYVIPQTIISYFDPEVLESETEWEFGIRGGLLIAYGIAFIGGEVNHIFVEDADPLLGIRGGLRF